MADKEIKLEFSKTEDGRNLLVLSSIYQYNCSDQKTVIVDGDVLEVSFGSRIVSGNAKGRASADTAAISILARMKISMQRLDL